MMTESAPSFLSGWSNFYVMIGSSAASLTGLMFVVITLITREDRTPDSRDGISTFSTPTVLHFGAVLLVAGILTAPWHSLVAPSVMIALMGLFGVLNSLRIMYRTARLKIYRPDLEDWTFYNILPFLANGAILVGAILLSRVPEKALFALAGGVVLLIFIGIRNAWDVVTFLATRGPTAPTKSDPS